MYHSFLTFFNSENVKTVIPVGKECVIKLDPSQAGEGQITCRIDSKADNDVDIEIIDNGDGTVNIAYTPKKPGAYNTDIKFGGKTIPDGKFTQQVSLDSSSLINLSTRVRYVVLTHLASGWNMWKVEQALI